MKQIAALVGRIGSRPTPSARVFRTVSSWWIAKRQRHRTPRNRTRDRGTAFSRLNEEQRARLRAAGEVRPVKPGQVLLREGEDDDYLYAGRQRDLPSSARQRRLLTKPYGRLEAEPAIAGDGS
jgi:hypothetical protein